MTDEYLLNGGVPAPTLGLDFAAGFDGRIGFTRASTGSYFDKTGTLQSAGSNLPRLDFDPVTLSPRGLLIEEQRTNLIANANAGMTAANGPNTAGASTAITKLYPAATMLKHTRDTTQPDTNVGAISTIAVSAGNVYTGSVWIWVPSSYSGSALALAFEGVGAGSIVTSTQINMSKRDQWQLIWCAFSSGTATSLALVLRMTGAVTGDFVYSQLPQAELGSFPTSYIPTTGTTATRSADVAAMAVVTPWYNPVAGTLLVKLRLIGQPSSFSRIAAFVGADVDANDLAVYIQSSDSKVRATARVASAVTGGPAVAGLFVPGQTSQVAMTYGGARIAIAQDGAIYQSAALSALPVISALRLCGHSGSQDAPSGWLMAARYWPIDLTRQQALQATR